MNKRWPMANTVRAALLFLSLFPMVDGITDTIRDEEINIPAIVERVDAPGKHADANLLPVTANGSGTAMKFIATGGLLTAARFFGSSSSTASSSAETTNSARFDLQCVVPVLTDQPFSAPDVANAFNKSEKDLQKLVSYICDELDIGGANIGPIKAVFNENLVTVSLTGSAHVDDPEKYEVFVKLIEIFVHEKVDAAVEINLHRKGGFEDAFQAAVGDELEGGRRALMQILKTFKPRRGGATA